MTMLLVAGHITHDRVPGGITPGGSVYYAAQAWAALGVDARVVSVVGDDFAAPAALEGLTSELRRGGRTTVFRNHYPEDGPRVQWVDAVAPAVAPDFVPSSWRRPDVAFLAPVLGEIELVSWRQEFHPRVRAIAVQGWVRAAEPKADEDGARRVVPRVWRPRPEELAGVDVALLSDEDLEGQPTLLERLTAQVPLVVRTHGVRGCEVIAPDGCFAIDAYPTEEVDPTGAGDTFAAGFLLGLAEGRSPREAARLGAATASIIVEAPGGAALTRMREARARALELA